MAFTVGVTDFDAEIVWLVFFAQNAVEVNPVVFDIVDVVGNNIQINGMNELPIADVWKEVRLHDGNTIFFVSHKTSI